MLNFSNRASAIGIYTHTDTFFKKTVHMTFFFKTVLKLVFSQPEIGVKRTKIRLGATKPTLNRITWPGQVGQAHSDFGGPFSQLGPAPKSVILLERYLSHDILIIAGVAHLS